MMDTPGMGPRPSTATPVKKKRGRSFLVFFVAVAIAFLAGFLWQFYEATTVREQLSITEEQLRVERLRVRLSQAAMAASTGDYEASRQHMSDFFTRLQAQEEQLPEELRSVARDLLLQRDDVITGLSRARSEYAGVLYDMLGQFTGTAPAMGGAARPAPDAAGPAGPPDTAPVDTPVDTATGAPAGPQPPDTAG
jgi:hypothetical protein